MAFSQRDDFGDYFANIELSVGSGKANKWDDVLVVQSLLAIIYETWGPLISGRPTKDPVAVDTKLGANTPQLIAHFQRTVMKRSQPQGYVNRAPAGGKNLQFSTLYQINLRAAMVMATVSGFYGTKDTVDALADWHASLKGPLIKY